MADRILPTQKELCSVFAYDPQTGDLTWKVAHCKSSVIGERAGWSVKGGYRMVRAFGRQLAVHRVVWCMVHGHWPKQFIDHINGDPSDNRLSNLREASPTQNKRNSRTYSNNTTGAKGVELHSKKQGYNAVIKINGKRIHLGYFRDIESAKRCREAAERKHFGEFARSQ